MEYLSSVCNISFLKAVISGCLAVIITIFGEDQTGIAIVGALWFIDTATGVMWAMANNEYKSSIGFTKGFKKLYVMGVVFMTTSLMAVLHPELKILLNGILSFFAFNEAYSILENANKLYPNKIIQQVMTALGSAEQKNKK